VRGVEEWATINHVFVSVAGIQQQGFIVFFLLGLHLLYRINGEINLEEEEEEDSTGPAIPLTSSRCNDRVQTLMSS